MILIQMNKVVMKQFQVKILRLKHNQKTHLLNQQVLKMKMILKVLQMMVIKQNQSLNLKQKHKKKIILKKNYLKMILNLKKLLLNLRLMSMMTIFRNQHPKQKPKQQSKSKTFKKLRQKLKLNLLKIQKMLMISIQRIIVKLEG